MDFNLLLIDDNLFGFYKRQLWGWGSFYERMFLC